MLTAEQTEELVAEYVAIAMRAACDDETPEEAAEWARRMIAAGMHVAVQRRLASLYFA
jgi:hypothetical protein